MFSKKNIATVSNLRFISRTNFMHRVGHEKTSNTSGPGLLCSLFHSSGCSSIIKLKVFFSDFSMKICCGHSSEAPQ